MESKNTIILGSAEAALSRYISHETVDLVFTSPPYYNARPEYSEYDSYEKYLFAMYSVFQQCHRVLKEGGFFVLNCSPVLIPRESRSRQSKRLPIPFDLHNQMIKNGFDFIDDIIWEKPTGAGWASGRGRRFSKDRNPLQYKPVPITEYILVYRKHTDKLIDWNIRSHGKEIIEQSKIKDGYEITNVWKICPAHSKEHPAIFPNKLAENVIAYYSFVGDMVLDPFGGLGTTAKVAHALGRKFIYIERKEKYRNAFVRDLEMDLLDFVDVDLKEV